MQAFALASFLLECRAIKKIHMYLDMNRQKIQQSNIVFVFSVRNHFSRALRCGLQVEALSLSFCVETLSNLQSLQTADSCSTNTIVLLWITFASFVAKFLTKVAPILSLPPSSMVLLYLPFLEFSGLQYQPRNEYWTRFFLLQQRVEATCWSTPNLRWRHSASKNFDVT